MKNQTKYLGTRHLRVGLEISERSVKIVSIRLVEQPVLQSPVLSRQMVARIDLTGLPSVIESFNDPRIDIGVYHENEGHSYITHKSGLAHISIPFTSVDDLLSLQIKVTDLHNVAVKTYDYDHLLRIFDSPPKKMNAVYSFTIDDLRAHPHWNIVFGNQDAKAAFGRFEIYIDAARKYRWRLRRLDGEIVADSGQGYNTRDECERDLSWIRTYAGKALIVSLDMSNDNRAGSD